MPLARLASSRLVPLPLLRAAVHACVMAGCCSCRRKREATGSVQRVRGARRDASERRKRAAGEQSAFVERREVWRRVMQQRVRATELHIGLERRSSCGQGARLEASGALR